MPLKPHHRQELLGIVALLLGVVVGLTFLPGESSAASVGHVLWKYFGVGAPLFALLGIVVGVASFGHFATIGPRRIAALVVASVFLVPYSIAVLFVWSAVPPTYEQWPVVSRLAGIVVTAIADPLVRNLSRPISGVLGLFLWSAVTLVTIDWHPFRWLAATTAAKKEAGKASSESDEVIAPVRKRKPKVVAVPEPDGEPEEDEPPAIAGAPPKPKRERKRASTPPATATAGPSAEQGRLVFPIDRLDPPPVETSAGAEQEFERLGQVLVETLGTFKVGCKVVDRTTGPVVTRYEVAPDAGVKVGRIAALADDLALKMRAQSIRIVAPIPGKAAVGIEVPNPKARMVTLRALLETDTWRDSGFELPVVLGEDIEGEPKIADLARMPHLLIAGATGSGKSVCINTIITSLCYAHPPEDLRFLMIDPKMVELSVYQNLPHLRHAVVTNNHKAATVFKWAVREMDQRYKLLSANKARNLVDFNKKVRDGKPLLDQRETLATQAGMQAEPLFDTPYTRGKLPYIVLVVDELADLMMTVQGDIERPLATLAQKARAVGIHIILATQRPSVNVITGLIKANFPCRIAFRVSAKVDSRTILDQNGAEALLGNGDMLFLPPGKSEPIRIQGAFINTEETERVMEWYHTHPWHPKAEGNILEEMATIEAAESSSDGKEGETPAGERDSRFREAAELCIQNQLGSTSLLQRRMSVGYGRAARIVDQLHDAGILGPADGSKPREVLIGMDQLDEYTS